MNVQSEGRYRGYAVSVGVAYNENKVLQWSGNMHLVEKLVDGQWQTIEPQNITAFQYLTKKDDGSINERTVETLRNAFGWDGCDPFWFHDNDVSQILVQVTVKTDTFNNKTSLKVRYLDRGDAEPKPMSDGLVTRASDSERRQISAELGARFRARAGGTSSMPPLPPKAGPPAAPSAPPAAVPKATMDDAWEAFCRFYKGDDEKKREAEWWKILKQQFGPRLVPQDIQPGEWGKLVAEMQTLVNVPF